MALDCEKGAGRGAFRAAAALAAPYLLWIAFILAFQVAGAMSVNVPRAAAPVAYAIKTALCAALIFALRPWRVAAAGQGNGAAAGRSALRDVAAGLAVGLAVAVAWILPETPWAYAKLRAFSLFSNKWLIMPLGAWPEYFDPALFPAVPQTSSGLAFSPDEAGWPLAVARLCGSAFVISAAEELFFRGFLYRWLQSRDWRSVPLSAFDAQAFWTVVAVFAFEHDRWFMGAVAGAAYGMLAVRTGGLRAPTIAHAVTNLTLGLYVLASGQYGFW